MVHVVRCSLGCQRHCPRPQNECQHKKPLSATLALLRRQRLLASCSLGSQPVGPSAQSQPTLNATLFLPYCAGGGGGGGYGGREEANPFEAADKSRAEADNLFSNDNTGIDFDAYDDIPVEATGNDVPAAINTFGDVDLGEALAVNVSCCVAIPSCITHHECCMLGGGLREAAQAGQESKMHSGLMWRRACNIPDATQLASATMGMPWQPLHSAGAVLLVWGRLTGRVRLSPNRHGQPRCSALHLVPDCLALA